MSTADSELLEVKRFEYTLHRLLHRDSPEPQYVNPPNMEVFISDLENFYINVLVMFGGVSRDESTMLQITLCSPTGLANLIKASQASAETKIILPFSGMHHVFMLNFNQQEFEDYVQRCFEAVNQEPAEDRAKLLEKLGNSELMLTWCSLDEILDPN